MLSLSLCDHPLPSGLTLPQPDLHLLGDLKLPNTHCIHNTRSPPFVIATPCCKRVHLRVCVHVHVHVCVCMRYCTYVYSVCFPILYRMLSQDNSTRNIHTRLPSLNLWIFAVILCLYFTGLGKPPPQLQF